MTEPNRFLDTIEILYQFSDEYLVVCPQCGGCARIAPTNIEHQNFFAPHRITCQSCSYSKDWDGTTTEIGSASDCYFGLPLWLQTEVSDGILWFHNLRHLQYIEAFVRSTLRERRTDIYGYRNASIISRLPNWIKAAKNRRQILKAIERLKQK
jgi:hypothetical protein